MVPVQNCLRESLIKYGKGVLELINLFYGIEILSGKWLHFGIRGWSNSDWNKGAGPVNRRRWETPV